MKSGLPVQHFIAACNANDVVPEYLASHHYKPKAPVATISNAMDVGDPSNFIRIQQLFGMDASELKKVFSSVSITDDETKQTINRIYQEYNYLLDPHGAVGFLALERYLNNSHLQKGIFAETAHPVKFYDVVEPVIQQKIPLPESIEKIIHKTKMSVKMEADYNSLREWLLSMK
jgi:threonine synthase